MYEKSFFQRVHLQQICEFFRTGGGKVPGTEEEGTLEDRFYRAEQSWRQAMAAYRKNVLAAQWENKTLSEQGFLDEELQQDILAAEERQRRSTLRRAFWRASAWAGSCPPGGRCRMDPGTADKKPAPKQGAGGRIDRVLQMLRAE